MSNYEIQQQTRFAQSRTSSYEKQANGFSHEISLVNDLMLTYQISHEHWVIKRKDPNKL